MRTVLSQTRSFSFSLFPTPSRHSSRPSLLVAPATNGSLPLAPYGPDPRSCRVRATPPDEEALSGVEAMTCAPCSPLLATLSPAPARRQSLGTLMLGTRMFVKAPADLFPSLRLERTPGSSRQASASTRVLPATTATPTVLHPGSEICDATKALTWLVLSEAFISDSADLPLAQREWIRLSRGPVSWFVMLVILAAVSASFDATTRMRLTNMASSP